MLSDSYCLPFSAYQVMLDIQVFFAYTHLDVVVVPSVVECVHFQELPVSKQYEL